MKTKLFLALLSGFSILAKAESIPTNLIVWARDGTKVAYAFAKKPKVTFTETKSAPIVKRMIPCEGGFIGIYF